MSTFALPATFLVFSPLGMVAGCELYIGLVMLSIKALAEDMVMLKIVKATSFRAYR